MKGCSKRTICVFVSLFTCLAVGPLFAKDKTIDKKAEQTVDKSEKAVIKRMHEWAQKSRKRTKELAKEKAQEIHHKAKPKKKVSQKH